MCGRDPIPPRLAHKHRARSRCSDLSGTPAKPRGPWVHPCTPAPGANEVPGAHRVVAAIDRPRERTPGRPRSGGRGQELTRVGGRSAQADRTNGGGCGRGPNTPATGFRSSRCRRGETAREKTHTARLHAPGVTSLSLIRKAASPPRERPKTRRSRREHARLWAGTRTIDHRSGDLQPDLSQVHAQQGLLTLSGIRRSLITSPAPGAGSRAGPAQPLRMALRGSAWR